MRRLVVCVSFPGFQLLDMAGPIAAFEMANRFVPESYRLAVLSHGGRLIESSSGVVIATHPYDSAEPPDTLMVVGGEGVIEACDCPVTVEFIRHCAGPARRVASVCSGAYLLAAAGLLAINKLASLPDKSCSGKVRSESAGNAAATLRMVNVTVVPSLRRATTVYKFQALNALRLAKLGLA